MSDWTTRRLAEAAGKGGRPVTQEYIRQLCVGGHIEASKPGRDWFIPEEEARAWLERWLSGQMGKTVDNRP